MTTDEQTLRAQIAAARQDERATAAALRTMQAHIATLEAALFSLLVPHISEGHDTVEPVGMVFALGKQFIEVRMRGERLEVSAIGPWYPSLIIEPSDHRRLYLSLTPEEIAP